MAANKKTAIMAVFYCRILLEKVCHMEDGFNAINIR